MPWFSSLPRRLLTAGAMMLALACGLCLPSTALAEDSHAGLDITISENDEIEVVLSVVLPGASRSELDDTCNREGLDEEVASHISISVDVDTSRDRCSITVTGLDTDDFNELALGHISHVDDSYEIKIDAGIRGSGAPVNATVTFPGKVLSASGDGKVDGSTVVWENAQQESESLAATGSDSAGSSASTTMLVLILSSVSIAVVIIIVAIILTTNRKKQPVVATYPMMGTMGPPSVQRPTPPAGQPAPYRGAQQQYPTTTQPYQPPVAPYTAPQSGTGYGQPPDDSRFQPRNQPQPPARPVPPQQDVNPYNQADPYGPNDPGGYPGGYGRPRP